MKERGPRVTEAESAEAAWAQARLDVRQAWQLLVAGGVFAALLRELWGELLLRGLLGVGTCGCLAVGLVLYLSARRRLGRLSQLPSARVVQGPRR